MTGKAFLNDLARDERGASAVEYGVLVMLIALALLGALQIMGGSVIANWDDVAAKTSAK